MSPDTKILETVAEEISLGPMYQVIVFNDDWHTFDDVAYQVRKATGYSLARGYQISDIVHNEGRVVVIVAHLEKCEHVALVLEEIRLGTKIEKL